MQFKHEKDKELFYTLHPLLIMVIADMNLYCVNNDMPFVITETITTLEQDAKLKRISSSHRTKRASDISVKGWSKDNIKNFVDHFNNKYEDIASISASDLVRRLVVCHNSGYGNHCHIALHSKYSL